MKFDKIKIINRPKASCDYHRIYLPFKSLGYNFNEKKIVQDCKLLIFNRLPTFSNELLFSLKRQYGFKYIVDLDDYWILDSKHYLYNSYKSNETSKKIVDVIKNADAITVTNSLLADKVKDINKNVYIIPNAIQIKKDQFSLKINNNSYVTRFIYAGGLSHLDDIKLISVPLYKTNVNFTLAGFNASNEQSLLMKKNLPPNTYLIPSKSLDKYMEVYDYMDVSLVPLVKSLFNECKSNLKILEAGCKGIAAIASKIHPYYNDIDKKFIDYAENESDWITLLNYYKNNKNYAIDMGSQLFEHVSKNYNLEKVNKLRIELIQNLLN